MAPKFVRHRQDPTAVWPYLDEGKGWYVVQDTVTGGPLCVSKSEYEPVPEADPAWLNVTPSAHIEASHSNGKHSLFIGHKRIGYILVHTPYRIRQTGEYLVLEKPDEV